MGNTVDVITLTDVNGVSTTISVTVGPGIAIGPANPSVASGGNVHLTASGGSGTGYTWRLTDASGGGTVDPATGVYTGARTAASPVARTSSRSPTRSATRRASPSRRARPARPSSPGALPGADVRPPVPSLSGSGRSSGWWRCSSPTVAVAERQAAFEAEATARRSLANRHGIGRPVERVLGLFGETRRSARPPDADSNRDRRGEPPRSDGEHLYRRSLRRHQSSRTGGGPDPAEVQTATQSSADLGRWRDPVGPGDAERKSPSRRKRDGGYSSSTSPSNQPRRFRTSSGSRARRPPNERHDRCRGDGIAADRRPP